MNDKSTGTPLYIPNNDKTEERIAVFGPASLSNLGPGFDTLGLCLTGIGDIIEASFSEEPGIHVIQGAGAVDVAMPTDPAKNTAARAASMVLEKSGEQRGLTLCIRKGIALGSGIGGSAASAVAGAWAVNVLLGQRYSKEELVQAVLEGEYLASGSYHGDNVLPALFGGLVLVSPSQPTQYRRIDLPSPLFIALVQPAIKILTHEARSILPSKVPLRDAVHNAADLAFMIDAFRQGDWEAVGRCMMRDRLVEPVRADLVPCFGAVRDAALASGAYGCALTGSGPAMFALAESRLQADAISQAMVEAVQAQAIEADGCVAEANVEGVRVIHDS